MLEHDRKNRSGDYEDGFTDAIRDHQGKQEAADDAIRNDSDLRVALVNYAKLLQDDLIDLGATVAARKRDGADWFEIDRWSDNALWILAEIITGGEIPRNDVIHVSQVTAEHFAYRLNCETYSKVVRPLEVDHDEQARHLDRAYNYYHARYDNRTYHWFRDELKAHGIHEDAICDRCNELTDGCIERSLTAVGGYHRKYAHAQSKFWSAIAAMPQAIKDAAKAHLSNF